MMLQLKVIWYLFNLCAIALAWTVLGSTGFTTLAFSVEEQKLSYIPSAAPFLNGSTVQPPLTSRPFESSPPGPPQLPSTPTLSPTQSAVAPSTKNPPSPDTSIKISPSTEPPSSAPPPLPQVPLHDLAPQKPTQFHAPPPVALPPHNVTPSLPVVSPQASVPIAVPSHVPQPPVTPSHVFAPPPLVSPPTSATTPPSITSPAISPSISSLSPPVQPLPSSKAPPPLPSKYASPPSIVAMPSHSVSALSPQTTPTHSKMPNHPAPPSPLLDVMPLAVPSHEFGSPLAMPPKPRAPSKSSAPPPQVIPSDVTAPPHPSATPPITLPSHALVPPPFDKSQVLASPPINMPSVWAPPPNSTTSKDPSTQSPLPAPAHASNPPPIVLSSPPGAVPSHDLAPPPTHTSFISAPPPNATISQQTPAPLPPAPPIHASNPPPRLMPPTVSSPPPDAAPSHDLASSPPPESHFSAPPPNATISQNSSAPLPPAPPMNASNTLPRLMPPTVSSPPPDAASSHNLASSPPPESHFSAPPPNAPISQNSSAPLPPTLMNATNTPPHAMSPIVSLPPPDAAPSHDLAPSPPAESQFSPPPPSKHNFSTPPTTSPTSKNASNSPSSSVPSHASAPSTAAEPPVTASPPSAHTLPSGFLPPVTSNSSAPLAAPPVRSPSFDPVVPRESPSIPPEAQLPRVSSPAPSIDQRGHQVPVHVAPSGPTNPLSPTNDHPEQGFSPLIAPSTHKSRGLPIVAPAATISPPISPTAGAADSPSFSPLPSTNKTNHHSAPGTSYTVPSPAPKQQGQVESPHSLLAPAPESTQRYHPPTSHNPGSSADMAPSQSPSTENYISPVPTSAIPDPSGHSMTPFLSPKISPSGSPTKEPTKEPHIELAPPILALPPPPPNHDCLSYTCLEPYTNTIPGSPCNCVFPMKVELRIGVALYTFFPLVPELAREIATGIFVKPAQVRITGANAASEQPEKTLLLIDLVPLGDKFDNITAFLIYERFWNKQVAISKSLFGDYEVLYVQYPGLPPSPPTAPSDIADINGGAYPGDNGSKIHPLGVDVTKKGRKNRLSGSLIAIIVFSAVGAVLLCLLLGWILLFRHRRHVNQSSEAPHTYPASVARSTGPTGQSIGSRPSFSLSFESSVAAYTGSAKTFSASEIENATDNFNLSRVLGEGGFGRVYSGVLEDGTEVAVKVLKREDQQGGREFLAEIEMLSRLHHRNLVKLIGICVEEHVRCLIYELIRNGSVESHLHGIDKESSPLDWGARMKIALGAARGLAYLHEDSSPRVIHRDFKASNILLETDFTPKVSDFGLARTAMDEENRHISTRVMGTFGYVAPEYAMTGHLLVKSDVYSYGVVLLELLTGRKPVDMSQPPGQENLVAWTRPYLTTKEALQSIVDSNLGPNISFDNVAKVAAIASMCVQPEVSHRPFMGEVVQALKLVCNECDDAKDKLDEMSPRSENLSRDRDVEKALSGSDVFSGTETGLACKESGSRSGSGSFRRHSSSGPIRGRSWRFWKRGRTTSSREDVVGENGLYRFWSGSH